MSSKRMGRARILLQLAKLSLQTLLRVTRSMGMKN